MLIRLAAASAFVAALVLVPPAVANARGPHGPIVVTTDNHQGEVRTTVHAPGAPATTTTGSVTDTGSESTSPCVWAPVATAVGLPLPSSEGGIPGSWVQQYCNHNGFAGLPVFVPNGDPVGNVPQVTPATLAVGAANKLRLPLPTAELNPSRQALVNLPEWFWVPSSQWRTLRQRTQAGRVWAVVVARPTTTTWNPGDGSPPFTCSGPGTPYLRTEPAAEQRSDCTYTYSQSSASRPKSGPSPNDRYFTVRLTTSWSVDWTGSGGAHGALAAMSRSATFPLAVAEREAIVTGASG